MIRLEVIDGGVDLDTGGRRAEVKVAILVDVGAGGGNGVYDWVSMRSSEKALKIPKSNCRSVGLRLRSKLDNILWWTP